MKKFVKILSNLALASLIVGGTVSVASCGNNNNNSDSTSAESTDKSNDSATDSTTGETEDTAKVAADLANLISLTVSGTKVDSNFTVPAYVGSGDSKTLLSWVSDDESLLTFTREGDSETFTATVHRPASDSEKEYTGVKFHAVVDYKGSKANSSDFNVRIRRQMSATEYYNEWITSTGVTQNVSGYVIAKLGYLSSYGEGNLVLWNDEVKGAYYVYNGYIDQDAYNNLALGTYVTASGATNTLYNGLLETKYGATFTVDSTKTIEVNTIARTSITEHILKNDLVKDNAPTTEAKKLQSTYVSLEGFTIKSVEKFSNKAGSSATTSQTVATLTRYGQDIKVVLMEGATTFAGDDAKAISQKFTTLGVGKKVSVKAILTWYNAPQLLVTSADDISECAADYTDSFADYDKAYDAAQLGSKDLLEEYARNTETAVPTSSNGATISYTVTGDCVSYVDGKITITVGDTEKTGTIVVKATSGEISYTITKYISAQYLTDEQICEKVANEVSFDEITEPKVITLKDKAFNDTVTLTYEIVDGADVASIDKDGKLVVIPATEAKKFKIKVTATLGDKSKDKTIEVSVAALPVTSIADVLSAKYDSSNPVYYCVEGYVTNIYNTKFGNCYIDVEFGTQKKTLCIYGSYDIYGTQYGNLANDSTYKFVLGKKVKFYGLLAQNNKINQLKNAKILSVESDPAVDAQIKVNEAAALFETSYSKAATVTLPEGITADITKATSCSLADQVVTIKPTDTEVTNEVTLSCVVGDKTYTATAKFTAKTVSIKKYTEAQITNVTTVDAAYTGGATGNAKGENVTADLGVTDTNITITTQKNACNNALGYNIKNNFRLYADATNCNGTSLQISVKEGYAIKSITFEYVSGSKTPTVYLLDNSELTGTDGAYFVGAQDVVIQNKQSSGQVQITKITIVYGSVTE